MTTISAFQYVPPFAQGVVRDLRVRWALEEAGLPYQARLIGPADQQSPDYLALQPFGQVPVMQDGELTMFESGAIVLHIAQRSAVLMPKDEAGRARATTWIFAAVNTVEVPLQQLAMLDLFFADEEWARLRRPGAVEEVRKRLGQLAAWLGQRDYLDGAFSAGDLMMTTVLRMLRHTSIVDDYPTLKAYQLRCEARPAFQKALRDQMAAFEKA
ncbi:glutathione S-transferase family protein [Massilia antarctica]|uniref:glutathione S-transferase family protein n=1 Tax=Massilia antarctica TaxID=2765360 RepID=UPI0006BB8E5A|nr:glutathione S-transferase family protein [Massilia sp. H27-R4]MCY0914700.1 glutathione S-transferase family protein [Massilia sp. H27-R4]CUI08270.1 Glutathione S-transferase [Janthinobacterium sp. CG23_2]CUU32056.1 Glutathione S-transferase [Janthinobacterium sp. CG23_2]